MYFNPGDKIVCISNDGGLSSMLLTVGNTYTVERNTGDGLILEGIQSPVRSGWFYNRFKLLKEESLSPYQLWENNNAI